MDRRRLSEKVTSEQRAEEHEEVRPCNMEEEFRFYSKCIRKPLVGFMEKGHK